jgi:hypothetical protein
MHLTLMTSTHITSNWKENTNLETQRRDEEVLATGAESAEEGASSIAALLPCETLCSLLTELKQWESL